MNDMYPDSALEVLEQGGLVAKTPQPIMNEDYDEIDHLLMGAPPAVKFAEIGDSVAGRITRVYQVQVTDFETRAPQWWEDGSPKMQVVVILDVSDGAGLQSLYIASKGLREALRDACRDVGRGLRPGGYLAVKYTGDGEPFRKGVNPPKIYDAGYSPPDRLPLDKTNPAPNLRQAELVQGDEPPF